MGVSMGKATVGYNRAGVQKLLANIHASVITQAASKMKKNVNTLNSEVDRFWTGAGATQFKANMTSDVDAICNALNDSYASLQSEINAILNAMGEIDQNLVKARK